MASTYAATDAMPTEPFTGAEIDDSRTLLQLLMLLDRSGANDDEIEEALLLFAAEPLQRSLKQDIGPERLSIARLQREAAARGCNEDDASVTTYITYGYRLEWLPAVVAALDPPDEIETDGEHVFTGEEAVLLLLRRYRSTGPLRAMTWETGRSISAISEAVWYMVRLCPARLAMCRAVMRRCGVAAGGAHPLALPAPLRRARVHVVGAAFPRVC